MDSVKKIPPRFLFLLFIDFSEHFNFLLILIRFVDRLPDETVD